MYKNYIVASLLLLAGYSANTQSILTKHFSWDDESLPIASPGGLNLQYSGIWGMTVNNHEYAVLGGAGHVLFFDVTSPANTKLVGKFPGNVVTIWREFKSYKNRLYAVSDNSNEGLMIFDLSQAPDTIVRTYWSTALFNDAHSIALDTVSGHIYLNGGSSGQGVTILDVSQNPDQPVLLAKINQLPGGYIHDSYVRNDTLYASSGNNGYYIYDFKTDPLQPHLITSTSTGGYNHNSWLTADGKYAYYTEEVPQGRPIQIVDLSELTTTGQIETVGNGFLDFQVPSGTLAVAHNVYIKDHWLFDSQYEDGLLVYDITNPVNPVLAWKYDTHPENTIYNGYFGNWGNYPWFPSGTIIAGDMQNGLFVLGFPASATADPAIADPNVYVYPNPARDKASVFVPNNAAWTYRLMDLNGKVLRSGQGTSAISLLGIVPGMYLAEITVDGALPVLRKIVKE
jgi:choice-of-anchor B domain-containing protein